METVASMTHHCRTLLESTDIPAVYKAVIREKYDTVEKLLAEDLFKAKRCEAFGKGRVQKMLEHAQLLHDVPSAANAFSTLLYSSNALILFLQER